MSLRIFLQGDRELARGLVEGAQGLLDRLKTEMSFNKLPQLARTYVLESGEIIRVQSFFGQDTITIESPFEAPVLVEEEAVVEIPFIIQLMFFGSDGHRYYVFWNVDEDILLELTDTETGEVIEQPIHKDDLDDKVVGIAKGAYEDFEDMQMSEDAPSVDWSETSGGVPSLKTIRLFPFGGREIWLGGYKITLEIDPDKRVDAAGTIYEEVGTTLYVDGDRTYVVLNTWVIPGRWEWQEDVWYARLIAYDIDLNGIEPGLQDLHTDDTYTSVGHGFNLVDYYVSHGKVIYNLPNLIDDVRGFCATKTVSMDLHLEEGTGAEHATGQVKGNLYSPLTRELELFFDEVFDVNTAHDGPFPQSVPRELPNFWIDNVASAFTFEGRAIIFEQVVIEKLYEWNGSPFYSAEPEYDLKSTPTYDLSGRIWIQEDVEEIKNTDKVGEEAYDYQWNNFVEIDSDAIFDLVRAHPKHTGQERLYASLLVQ